MQKTNYSYTVEVYILGIASPLTFTDGEGSTAGTQAYKSFKGIGGYITSELEDKKVEIPKSSVAYVTYTWTTSTETVTDVICEPVTP